MPPGNKPWVHGSGVDKKTRKVRFLSVSQMEQGDSCLRRWFYEKVQGKKPPEDQWQTTGREAHSEIEHYLRTGEKLLSSLVMAGFWMLPDPGEDLLIERDLLVPLGEDFPVTAQNSQALLDHAPLRAAGIPVLGQLDCAHDRGVNKGGSDIEAVKDPDGTVEVIDWKTTSDFKWAKTGIQLLNTIQMSGYGMWILNQRPETRFIRLSHGYFRTKGAPAARKATYLARPEEIRQSWEHAEGVASLIARAATAKAAEDVDANLDACDKYRGCPHRSYCTAGMDRGVSVVLGLTASDALKNSNQGTVPVGSILKMVNKKAVETAPPPSQAAVDAARAKLEAEEKAAKLRALIPEGFQALVNEVVALNVGFPKLTGRAARAYAALGGQAVEEGHEFPGSGTYGYVEIEDPALFSDLLNDLKAAIAEGADGASPIPPDAPMSDPALAAKTEEPAATVEAPAKKKKKTAEKTAPAVNTDALTEGKNHLPAELAAKTLTEQAHQDGVISKSPAGNVINLFIDCRPSGDYVDLYSLINEWAKRLTETAGTTVIDGKVYTPPDLRACPESTALGFTKWEGVFFSFVQSEAHCPLPPGNYYVDTRGNRVRLIAADALKARAQASGGMYVQP